MGSPTFHKLTGLNLNPKRHPALPYNIRVLSRHGLRIAAVEAFFYAIRIARKYS
jgi:hypothetical protein